MNSSWRMTAYKETGISFVTFCACRSEEIGTQIGYDGDDLLKYKGPICLAGSVIVLTLGFMWGRRTRLRVAARIGYTLVLALFAGYTIRCLHFIRHIVKRFFTGLRVCL